MEYWLAPRYETAQSFYNKAKVVVEYDTKSLISYGVCICQIAKVGLETVVKIYNFCDYNGKSLTFSNTSLRHLKEFLKQEGFKAESSTQIQNDYLVSETEQIERKPYGYKGGHN